MQWMDYMSYGQKQTQSERSARTAGDFGDNPLVPDIPSDMISTVEFAPDSTIIATGGFGVNQAILIRDTTTGRGLRSFKSQDDVIYALAFSPNGKTIASACGDGEICIWDHRPDARSDECEDIREEFAL